MPRECLVCGRQLGAQERHLCIWCAADLPETHYWEQPHNPMSDQFNALLERQRPEGEAMQYAYATALLFYHHENPYKYIPRALKYGGNLQAGRFFAARLGAHMARQRHFADIDTVLPVPLHWWRKWNRGYNQAEVIAAELAKALHAQLRPGDLVRLRRTRSQTRLDAEARVRNVEGVFALRHAFPARHVPRPQCRGGIRPPPRLPCPARAAGGRYLHHRRHARGMLQRSTERPRALRTHLHRHARRGPGLAGGGGIGC